MSTRATERFERRTTWCRPWWGIFALARAMRSRRMKQTAASTHWWGVLAGRDGCRVGSVRSSGWSRPGERGEDEVSCRARTVELKSDPPGGTPASPEMAGLWQVDRDGHDLRCARR